MAEKIVSPGVFTNEIDQSFLPAGVQAIGAAVVGPTLKGRAGIPTIVSSYQEYLQIFGGKIKSGSGAQEQEYKFFTDYAAQEYLKYADTLTVVRILPNDCSPAHSVVSSSVTAGTQFGTGSYTMNFNPTGSLSAGGPDEFIIGSVHFTFVSESAGLQDTAQQIFVEFGSGGANDAANEVLAVTNLKNAINNNNALTGLNITAANGAATNILKLSGSSAGSYANYTVTTGSAGDATATTPSYISATVAAGVGGIGGTPFNMAGGADATTNASAFTLTTLSDGALQNSIGPEVTNNLLSSGSNINLRWEVSRVNNNKGTFDLLIRRGDDTIKRKTILEQYSNLTLDPNTPNFIGRAIGDQVNTLRDSGELVPFLQLSGSHPNRSKYVRVTVHNTTLNYLDSNGNLRDANLSGSLPSIGSGSFDYGSDGSVVHPFQFNENITGTNTQGLNVTNPSNGKTAYQDAIRLLGNQDEYDINLLSLPGLVDNETSHATVLTEALSVVENRGDCFLIIDPVNYNTAISSVTAQAESRDSNYAAEYWPWIKIPDPDLGKNVWVPAGTLVPGVYAFNDRVAAPWFAPAGLNRGGIDIAVQAERKLTHGNRDTLYDSGVNPIATFPNAGVTVFGQKTLQKKASALDRVNVRRLLIAAKKFIASTTRFLVFENNTAATRNRFLSIVNPYFESVQQRQGLYAFKVVMDETNNTPDVIDRNEMRGQIFLQPAKTAEFIIVDFNVLPTGAAFPE